MEVRASTLSFQVNMVKFTFASASLILATLSSFTSASPIERRDVSKVTSDLNQLSEYVTTLQGEASSLSPGISIPDALAINNHVQGVHKALDTSATDVAGLQSVSESDAQTILSQMNTIAPSVTSVLNVVCERKNVLMTLPFSMNKLTQDRLGGLQDSANQLFDAMQNTFPSADAEQVESIRNTVGSAFQSAVACFGN
ncbi:hypothetical protein AX15_005216 [Amanita polypyramis BW_CC]|nr:hypothetical protein AX15_005216 [Amanita polypyramis BW_CC]